MTSTMKSDPSGPAAFANSFGVPVSAAAIWAFGRSAEGSRAGSASVVAPGAAAACAGSCGDTAVAAPVKATPAINLRRLKSRPFTAEPCGLLSLLAIGSSFCGPRAGRGQCDRFARRYGHSYEKRQILGYHDRRLCHLGIRLAPPSSLRPMHSTRLQPHVGLWTFAWGFGGHFDCAHTGRGAGARMLDRGENDMDLQIRRIVTGHNADGRAEVKIDEICRNLISTRKGQQSCLV